MSVCRWIERYFSCRYSNSPSGSLISDIKLSALKCHSSISRKRRTLGSPHFQRFRFAADFAVWVPEMKQIGMFPRQHINWNKSELNKIFMICIYEMCFLSNTIELQSILMFRPYLYNSGCVSCWIVEIRESGEIFFFWNETESGKIEIRFGDDLIDIECAFSTFHDNSPIMHEIFFSVKADYDRSWNSLQSIAVHVSSKCQ